MNSKLATIGMILITLGVTLTVTTYLNVNYWQKQLIDRMIFVIDSNSSSSQPFPQYLKPISLKQVEVQIEPSDLVNLEAFLNSTMLSNYHLYHGWNPITVTLGDSHRNISAVLQTFVKLETGNWDLVPQPVHTFDIPENWDHISNITMTNPENFPVILIVETTGNYLLVNDNWQTAMYVGIASTVVGAVIAGISVWFRELSVWVEEYQKKQSLNAHNCSRNKIQVLYHDR